MQKSESNWFWWAANYPGINHSDKNQHDENLTNKSQGCEK